MAHTIERELKKLKPYYSQIEALEKEITAINKSVIDAKAKIPDEDPLENFDENANLEAEKNRQWHESFEKFYPTYIRIQIFRWVTHLVLVTVMDILLFVLTGNADIIFSSDFFVELLNIAIYSAIPLFFLLRYLAKKLENSLKPPAISDFAALKQAEEQDKQDKENRIRNYENRKAQAITAHQALSAKASIQIEQKKNEIRSLLSQAQATYPLPKEYCSPSGLQTLLSNYDDCCAKWCKGRDPDDLLILVRYCNSVAKAAQREHDRWYANMVMELYDKQEQERRDKEFAYEQEQTRRAHREAEKAYDATRKELEDLQKRL